jgi:hypothetical protein
MTSRLEQQANRALLIALTVFVGALFFNINTGNKTMGFLGSGILSDITAAIGSATGLPEFGISESLNGGAAPPNAQPLSGVLGTSTNTSAPTQQFGQPNGQTDINYSGGVDPNAQIAAQYAANQQANAAAAAMSAARNNFNSGRDTLYGSVNRLGDNKALDYKGSINDWLLQDKMSQDAINAKGVNAEMARNQGVQGIRSMVGNGIKSAGVMLGNKNAGSSSAAGALANAYGQLGQRQMQQVGNQYGVAENQIGLEQQNLEGARNLQKGKFADYKTQTVNAIVDDAQRQMAALNADAANASLPDQIAIQQEVERIRGEAMGKLQQFDSLLQTQAQATNRDQRMTECNRLQSLGMGGDNPYQFTTQDPTGQFQTQAPAGGLPIYTYNKNKYTA